MKTKRESLVLDTNTDIDGILKERGDRYGDFRLFSNMTEAILRELLDCPREHLLPYQKEAIRMIVHKLCRISNGDPHHIDSWVDIVGYATLVIRELEKNESKES